MNKSIITLLLTVFSFGTLAAQSYRYSTTAKKKDQHYFSTSIKDATWKRDVEDCFIIPLDKDGNPGDTIRSTSYKYDGSGMVKTSDIDVPVMPGDTSVIFEAGAPGFETQTIHWTFAPFGKREIARKMDPIYLNKVRMLKEVTVTASKVKFYNKGDTIVYDADAFQLAEGSMLDALISQMPGASIDENGRITVNGEFVEILLLNGKISLPTTIH